MGSNYNDEMDCGSFFDHIDDLIDFPSDNDIGFNSGNGNDFPSIWSNNVEDLPGPDPIFPGMKNDSASDLSAELAVPYEDIVQLEWLSTFVEDSFSGGGMTLNKENVPLNNNASQNQFRTSSPVSVLESSSSSSCSDGKIVPLSPSHRGPQRARSKRPRPANFRPRSTMQFVTPTSSVTPDNSGLVNVPMISSESENFVESLRIKIPKPVSENKKKQKQKPSFPSSSAEMNCSSPLQQQASVRKCLHCEITKTPQWRAGPLGPKTLCNACGVRYKSGRLFPEYRPAASPTFVPSLHSNSHKKVVEMRIKGGEKKFMNATVPPISSEPEMIPNASLEYM
ncbi:hypothetical protein DCAR_0207257 [Daucus carota subsp. sativus]|nr:hypothetical protein DCAR_0207257 [Daucus carota subsp. sativus]